MIVQSCDSSKSSFQKQVYIYVWDKKLILGGILEVFSFAFRESERDLQFSIIFFPHIWSVFLS